MTEKEEGKQNERERRRDLGIFFLILPIAIACMFCVGQRAITMDSPWNVNANMKSGIDANKDYLTKRSNGGVIEPISPDILTLPPWFNILTPPGTGLSTVAPNSSPVPQGTSASTQASTAAVTSAVTSAVTFVPPTLPSGGGGGGGGSTPKPTADLRITKTDGSSVYNPGSPVIYTIVVSNLSGATNVSNATVTDNFPVPLGGINWSCAGTGGATCSPTNGTSNINNSVNLPAGTSVTYVVGATVSLSASGNLTNTATVTAPMGINDPTAANNSATDVDTNGSILVADLQITKTDGSITYDVGNSITYTITASNPSGPGNISGATVTDIFPAVKLSNINWVCSGMNGATCAPSGTGNINDTVNLPITGSVTYTVSADISSSASGTLSNTATVSLPGGYTDPTPVNNSATDTDTPVFNVDLQIAKSDSVTTYTPGNSVTYSIVVTNSGILDATGASVTDTFPAQVSSATWTCVPSIGASCTAAGSGNISDSVNVPVGASLTYSVSATIYSSASGNMTNTATVSAPGGYTDTNLANNSASDTDTAAPGADLSITNDDASTDYVASGAKTYTIVVSNAGPSDVIGATVSDPVTANMSTFSWSCSTTGSATCGAGGVTSINDTINIPVGNTVTYTINITASAAPAGNLTNTATVSVPFGYTDPAGGNNSASDGPLSAGDQLITSSGTTYGNIGTGQSGPPVENLVTGSSIVLTLSSPVNVGSHGGYDLIYYEEPSGLGIQMDIVILQISDGSNWYTVLNWGNGISDGNTSIATPLGAPNPTTCSTEVDNCFIDPSFLDLSTGVKIDVDGLGIPAGSYAYFRIIAPATGDLDGNVGLDGIYVVP